VLEKNGIKIGVFGLAEKEWLEIVTKVDINIFSFEDLVGCA